jgi:6-phosphogluconolactonase
LKPDIQVFSDYQSLSSALADQILDEALRAVNERDCFKLVLNGGGTPQGLFELLGAPPFSRSMPWRRTEVFWGDERCVAPKEAGSSFQQAWEAFLGHVDIPSSQIFRIKGELGPDKASDDYALLLSRKSSSGLQWPIFDLVLLGVGSDGHTASLFPGQSFGTVRSATLAVTAHYEDRPANRVSLTPAVINSSRKIFIMASGESKSEIVKQVLQENDGARIKLPVEFMDPARSTWWLDKAAAGGL